MPNYWLGIMAVVIASALALWIGLVFRADSHPPRGTPQESVPHREVIGGSFVALKGGRQVMPDPEEPIVHPASASVPEQSTPRAADQATDAKVPEQRTARTPEQAQAAGDRPS